MVVQQNKVNNYLSMALGVDSMKKYDLIVEEVTRWVTMDKCLWIFQFNLRSIVIYPWLYFPDTIPRLTRRFSTPSPPPPSDSDIHWSTDISSWSPRESPGVKTISIGEFLSPRTSSGTNTFWPQWDTKFFSTKVVEIEGSFWWTIDQRSETAHWKYDWRYGKFWLNWKCEN